MGGGSGCGVLLWNVLVGGKLCVAVCEYWWYPWVCVIGFHVLFILAGVGVVDEG